METETDSASAVVVAMGTKGRKEPPKAKPLSLDQYSKLILRMVISLSICPSLSLSFSLLLSFSLSLLHRNPYTTRTYSIPSFHSIDSTLFRSTGSPPVSDWYHCQWRKVNEVVFLFQFSPPPLPLHLSTSPPLHHFKKLELFLASFITHTPLTCSYFTFFHRDCSPFGCTRIERTLALVDEKVTSVSSSLLSISFIYLFHLNCRNLNPSPSSPLPPSPMNCTF